MLSTLSETQKGILYGLTGYFIYVISDTVSKYLAQFYPILMIVWWMYFFALLVSLAFSPFTGGLKATLQTKKLKIHFSRGFFNFGLAMSVVTAFAHLPMSSVYPVLYLSPILSTVLAIPIFKEKVSHFSWGIIALAFSGVIICFQPWTGSVNHWIISAFITVFCISGLSIMARFLKNDETLLSLSFYPSIVITALLMPASLIFYPLPALQHLPIFILGGTALSFGLTFVALAFRSAPYAYIASINYLQLLPVFLAGYIVFGESPDFWTISGSLIIALSGVLLALSKGKSV